MKDIVLIIPKFTRIQRKQQITNKVIMWDLCAVTAYSIALILLILESRHHIIAIMHQRSIYYRIKIVMPSHTKQIVPKIKLFDHIIPYHYTKNLHFSPAGRQFVVVQYITAPFPVFVLAFVLVCLSPFQHSVL